MAVLPAAAYGGYKDVNEAWVAGVLRLGAWSTATASGHKEIEGAEDLREAWEERTAIMVYDGHLPHTEAECLAWAALSPSGEKP